MSDPNVDAVVVGIWVCMNDFNLAWRNRKQAAAKGSFDVQSLMAGQAKLGVEIAVDAEKLVDNPKFGRPGLKLKSVHLLLPPSPMVAGKMPALPECWLVTTILTIQFTVYNEFTLQQRDR
jgi:hypothetical protein